MGKDRTNPTLTDEDRDAIHAIYNAGQPLPCGGRTWAGPFNGITPIYRLIDKNARPNQVSARRLIYALGAEEHHGEIEWPTGNLYAEHWGCIDHLTFDRAKAAKEPDAQPHPPTDYVKIWAPEHPLATQAGTVLEHRAVLHDALGDGPVPCHWCGIELWWDAPLYSDDELTVDHLNWERDDNDLDNLVPACRPCNSSRRAVPTLTAETYEPFRPSDAPLAGQVSHQEAQPQTPHTPQTFEESRRGWLVEAFDVSERALDRLAKDRRARAILILAALAVAGFLGSGWLVHGGVGQIAPDVQVHVEPRPTLPAAPTTTQPATTTVATVATGPSWTMPPPCTPSDCPSLRD